MNDARFIELLNLYIDQELSAEEVGELQQAIAQSPARRRTYEQYCRMHRGCALLFESSRSQAPHSPKLDRSARDAERKVMALPGSGEAPVVRGPWGRVAWAGGLAAALTVAALQGPALMNALRSPDAAGPASAASAMVRAQPAAALAPEVRQSDYQLVGLFNRPADGSRLTFQPAVTPESAWLESLALTPLQRVSVENLRFTAETTPQDERTFAGSQPFNPAQSAVEFSAFQFRK
jgi:anti-sigma factor RsiW